MKVTAFFAWYDLWIGAYYDRKYRQLYICPLPTIVIQIDLQKYSQLRADWPVVELSHCAQPALTNAELWPGGLHLTANEIVTPQVIDLPEWDDPYPPHTREVITDFTKKANEIHKRKPKLADYLVLADDWKYQCPPQDYPFRVLFICYHCGKNFSRLLKPGQHAYKDGHGMYIEVDPSDHMRDIVVCPKCQDRSSIFIRRKNWDDGGLTPREKEKMELMGKGIMNHI